MFVSIHIPKTAGTALAKVFDDTSLRRIMYDYGSEMALSTVRTCPEDICEHKDFIKGYFKYFHGHFHYLKYAEVFSDCPFITMVRHPVERVISQYHHILRSGNRQLDRHRLIMDGELSITEFAESPYVGNAQWSYLEGRAINDYDFVFVQEYFEVSLQKFAARFQIKEISDYLSWNAGAPKVNQKPTHQLTNKALEVTEADRLKIFNLCEKDIELYRRAEEMLWKI
jgi:hypothetical protein